MHKSKAVVIVEDTCNSLGIIRGLSQRGIPVVKFGYVDHQLAFSSRYGRKIAAPDLEASDDSFIKALINFGRKESPKPTLFITNDSALTRILEYSNCITDLYSMSSRYQESHITTIPLIISEYEWFSSTFNNYLVTSLIS